MKQTKSEKQRNNLHRHYQRKLRRFNNDTSDTGKPVEVDITRKIFWRMERQGKHRRQRPGAIKKMIAAMKRRWLNGLIKTA